MIVAAALIMSSVFFSFLLSPDRVSKEFGLLLGVAILCDALLMRMTFVPALLTLLGEKSWWIPRWLAKILPNITIEAPGERPEAASRPAPQRPADSHRLLAPTGVASAPASPPGHDAVGASAPVRSASACWKSSRETSPFA